MYLISQYLNTALRDLGSHSLCETFQWYHNTKWYLHVNISICVLSTGKCCDIFTFFPHRGAWSTKNDSIFLKHFDLCMHVCIPVFAFWCVCLLVCFYLLMT